MRSVVLVAVILFGISTNGCGDDDGDSCGKITDTFTITETRLSGDCPVDPDPFTIQVFERSDGNVELVFEGLFGNCPGVLSGCDIVTTCREYVAGTADLVALYNIDFTLGPDGLTGEYTVNLNPGIHPDYPNGCSGRFSVTGTR